MLYPDGKSLVLDVPTGTPIGVDSIFCETVTYDIAPGTTLFFLTDGLVSSPTMDIHDGLNRLSASLSKAHATAGSTPPPLEDLAEAPLKALFQEGRHDDAVLLAARMS